MNSSDQFGMQEYRNALRDYRLAISRLDGLTGPELAVALKIAEEAQAHFSALREQIDPEGPVLGVRIEPDSFI
jgi:hypothetical protein